jgi:hypothetical protein
VPAAPAEQGGGFLASLFGKPKTAPAQPAANAALPAMCMFVTDGRPDDKSRAADLLRKAKAHSIYWQLVGVGNPDQFEFLQEMADELPNVGYVPLDDLDMSDEQLYAHLLSDELCTWVRTR